MHEAVFPVFTLSDLYSNLPDGISKEDPPVIEILGHPVQLTTRRAGRGRRFHFVCEQCGKATTSLYDKNGKKLICQRCYGKEAYILRRLHRSPFYEYYRQALKFRKLEKQLEISGRFRPWRRKEIEHAYRELI